MEIEDDDNSSPKEEISSSNMPFLNFSLYVSFIMITNILLVHQQLSKENSHFIYSSSLDASSPVSSESDPSLPLEEDTLPLVPTALPLESESLPLGFDHSSAAPDQLPPTSDSNHCATPQICTSISFFS